MPFYDDTYEAPMLTIGDQADNSDVYAFFAAEQTGDASAKEALDFDLLTNETANSTGSTLISLDTSAADAFVFLSGAPDTGNAVPGNATDAPEEEPAKSYFEEDAAKIGTARHSVMEYVLRYAGGLG